MTDPSSPAAPRLHLGASYYPEHWPEERWPEDIRLMKEAGLTVVRMGEFAWSTLEPSAGKFSFDWLERAIGLLAAAGIATVLGTPTAAPPVWLVEKYPDLLPLDESGRRVQFGNRCHYCVNSPELHAAAQRIVRAMAKKFGKNPNVIGWQIDNEFHRVCYCDRCRGLFQQFLQEKYGSLETLNERWSTRYWSQTYLAWEQIPIPIGTIHNPGLLLEFKHFITESYRKFQKIQLDALRPHLGEGVWATHNFMGWNEGYDHYVMAKDLDLVSWDWYVMTGHNDPFQSGSTHDLMRGLKQKNFWLLEVQPANGRWANVNNVLNKGEGRAMAWHAVAHGAEALLYWQWRSAPGGQEQYHGTLIDPSGRPRPFYEEVKLLGREFGTVSELLAGSTIKSRVAMLTCYPSRWSIGWQRHQSDFDYVKHFNLYYRSLAVRNLNVDVISADEPLAGYKLVVAPALHILTESRVAQLKEFVQKGGYLILTLRSGMKDEFNAMLPSRQPGPLAEMAGMEVEEYFALLNPVPVKGGLFDGTSKLWAERLKILDTNLAMATARYGAANGWLDNQVAVATHPYGNGVVYYVGAYLDEVSQQKLIDHILSIAGLKAIKTPAGVEVRTRTRSDGTDIYFIINHKQVQQAIQFPWPAHEHLSGQDVNRELKLPPYGAAVVTRVQNKDE